MAAGNAMTIQYGDKLVHRAELWASSRGRWTLEIAYSDEVIRRDA